ncbi:MAG: CAP domain-containing protein [Clostridiales bacterium]|nr:CAP domain-containing protein [Clostridiales bacterium]
MGIRKVIKAISKNMTIITIGAAFVLGFIGMSDVKAVLLNPSEDSVALLDTSTWFMKTDTGNAAGEDEGLRIVSEIGLSEEELEALNNRGSNESTVETDENGNPIDVSDPSANQGGADTSVSDNTGTDTLETPVDSSSSTDESLDPNMSGSMTETSDPKISSDTETKTSETTQEPTSATTTESAKVTTVETTEEPKETEAPEVTEPPETTTEAPPETTTEEPTETTTEAPPETTTEAPPETTAADSGSMGATGGSYDTDWAKTVLSLVNEERAANGLGALEWSGSLAKAAKTRAAEIVVKWSHTRPDGSEWWTVSDLTYGENLAYGQTSPSEVVEAWMNSAGHKANILGDYSSIGVACYYYDGTYYWVQEFGY